MTYPDRVPQLRKWVASLSPKLRREELERIGHAALYDWVIWVARDSQLLPEGLWLLWLVIAGRGWGKTRTGAETIRVWVDAHAASNYALLALRRQWRGM